MGDEDGRAGGSGRGSAGDGCGCAGGCGRAGGRGCAGGTGGDGNRRAGDAARLAAFDNFAAEVRSELAQVSERMEALRAENKVKTATYRQLFASRITLKDIDRRLTECGL